MTLITGQTLTLAQFIASRAAAKNNCRKTGNTLWESRHRQALMALRDLLPSGSGLDGTLGIVAGDCNHNSIVITASFHHMDEHGSYDGWTDHVIRASQSLVYGLSVSVSGRGKNGIKDYLSELFRQSLGRRYVETWNEETETFSFRPVE